MCCGHTPLVPPPCATQHLTEVLHTSFSLSSSPQWVSSLGDFGERHLEVSTSNLRTSVLHDSSMASCASSALPWDLWRAGFENPRIYRTCGKSCHIGWLAFLRRSLPYLDNGKRSDWLDASKGSSYELSHSLRPGGLSYGGAIQPRHPFVPPSPSISPPEDVLPSFCPPRGL